MGVQQPVSKLLSLGNPAASFVGTPPQYVLVRNLGPSVGIKGIANYWDINTADGLL